MKKLAIIGSGDLGQLIAHHALADGQYELAGFFDDYKSKGEIVGLGPVIGVVDEVQKAFLNGAFDCLMVGVGYNHPDFRKKCFDAYFGKVPFATLVHSSCYVDASARVAEGAFLLPGCVLDRGVIVEENALLNTGCNVAHDTVIGKHSFLGPGVVLAGFITIGEGCFIGVGTTVIDNVSIVPHVQTGGGAVVVRDLNEAGLYIGIPARKVS